MSSERNGNGGAAPAAARLGDDAMNRDFAFILIPEFSMMALTAAIDPLRHANHVLGHDHYRWSVYSETGAPVLSSSGLELMPKGDLGSVDPRATAILCGGPNVGHHTSEKMLKWIRQAARSAPIIGGLCTAPRLLAEAGILDGCRATIHWESLAAFREAFPKVTVCESLFEFDRNRMTCAGETAGIDMMVTLLAARHGKELAAQVAAQVLHGRIRAAAESQSPVQVRYGTRHPKLLQIIAVMEDNIEDPLELPEIAARAGCSRRQVERMFVRHVDCSPVEFYRRIRLERARRLLLESDMNCAEVATACGFSLGGFSRAYRQRFGIAPHQECGIPRLRTAV